MWHDIQTGYRTVMKHDIYKSHIASIKTIYLIRKLHNI